MSAIDKRASTTVQEGTLQFSMPLNHEGAVMELIADYLNRNGHEHTSYTLAAENAGATHNKNNLNLWKFKADFLYPHSRNLTWKFGTSVQKIS